MRYKIEVQDETGIWTDVRGPDGGILVYDDEGEARAALAEKFPVLVQMEKYAGMRMSLMNSMSVAVPLVFGVVGGSIGLSPVLWSVGVFLATGGWLTRVAKP